MKRIVLESEEIALLLKVERSEVGGGFYSSVAEFLEDNEDLPQGKTAVLEVEDREFFDISFVVKDYLADENINEDKKPSGNEFLGLIKLIGKLNSLS